MRFGLSFIVRRLGFRGVTSAIYHSSLVIRHLSFVTRHSSFITRHSTRSQFSLFAKEIRYLSLVISHFFLSLQQKTNRPHEEGPAYTYPNACRHHHSNAELFRRQPLPCAARPCRLPHGRAPRLGLRPAYIYRFCRHEPAA